MVSIIIPSYNYAHLLPETLKNVSEQSFHDWECLVIDDGSTDSTKEVMANFSAKDSRYRYIHQVNSGPQVARNNGIEKSKGDFIQFLDADDLLEPEKLKVQTEILQNQQADIVYSDMRYFSSAKPTEHFYSMSLNKSADHPWMQKVSGSGSVIVRSLLKENIMVINSPLIRKSVFEKHGYFDESLKFNEDWELWLRFAVNGVSFLYDETPGTKALVRVHEHSYSRDRFKMYVYGLKVCLGIRNKLNDKDFLRTIAIKILYHTRALDTEILETSKTDLAKSIEMAELVYTETGRSSYRKLSRLLKKSGTFSAEFYSSSLFAYNRIVLKFVYGY
ncbi:MAG: glycosyltransferase [Bacteroidota bacterium]|nr:glycosyltransferase [Bacteroidota bacterium]